VTRKHEPRLTVGGDAGDGDGLIHLTSPAVGWFRPTVRAGDLLNPGELLGTLEVLGKVHALVAPRHRGLVIGELSARGVGYGETLAVIDPALGHTAGATAVAEVASQSNAAAGSGVVFTAPTSGRYYGRPAPGKPPFVVVGDEVTEGRTLCLLEVMKTFNRVTYGGAALPARARVAEILAADESDVDAGAPLIRFEPVT
jgi:acetyl-CoA carboxylase biotin carboxyl carrier protein